MICSCQSPSDKQHSCECEYEDQEEFLIEDVNNFMDLNSAIECDQQCGFRRLLIYFYDDSDSTKKMNQFIEQNKTLKNSLNDNFAIVFLNVNNPTPLPTNEIEGEIKTEGQKNRALQLKIFNSNSIPMFGIMNTSKDSVLGMFDLESSLEQIDSIILDALTK